VKKSTKSNPWLIFVFNPDTFVSKVEARDARSLGGGALGDPLPALPPGRHERPELPPQPPQPRPSTPSTSGENGDKEKRMRYSFPPYATEEYHQGHEHEHRHEQTEEITEDTTDGIPIPLGVQMTGFWKFILKRLR
jgi:hypothetical protein